MGHVPKVKTLQQQVFFTNFRWFLSSGEDCEQDSSIPLQNSVDNSYLFILN
jgi:hypothetical protein